ncbi:MAG: type II/IV secretion system ATPase subunit [Candidatus Methanomethyliales bacterium]|nr:type II/IV secretion system ATPase subunit [Candidatus Methanomethylicales archaeon]
MKIPLKIPRLSLNLRKKHAEVSEVALLEMGKPKTLEEALSRCPYLQEYLERIGRRPAYVEELSYNTNPGERADIIYPVGEGIFVHVETGGEVGHYNVIEPPKQSPQVIEEVESAVALMITNSNSKNEKGKEKEKKDEKEKDEKKERAEVLTSLFKEAMKKGRLNVKGNPGWVLYHFLREKVGHGFLDPFLLDDYLEDISIPGGGRVFVYHKLFGYLETNVQVERAEVDRLLRSIAERYGKILSFSNPIVDIHLPDGSRFNIVFGEDISLKGSNFTIRKFSKEPISVAHLIKWGTLSPEMAAYLWMLLETGVSCFVCGETASGKTTTLNALTAFIKPNAKVVSIEETPEVNIPHKNWVREVTRLHSGSPVTMFDLVKAALRQRPDYIIIGEIRGEEGRIAFQAIETGHPVISTMHAGNLGQLFQRLTSDPINVPKSHVDSLNLAIFQARVERNHKFIRRVTSVNEIIGFDSDLGQLNFMPSFTYDFDADEHRFTGSSFLVEAKVLPLRGLGIGDLDRLYEEMRMRAGILKWLAENDPKYASVWKTVISVDNYGVEWAYSRIEKGLKPWGEEEE